MLSHQKIEAMIGKDMEDLEEITSLPSTAFPPRFQAILDEAGGGLLCS